MPDTTREPPAEGGIQQRITPTGYSQITDAINPEIVRGVLRQVDRVGWQISHHLPVDLLNLSLDEACHVGAALRRFLCEVDHGR